MAVKDGLKSRKILESISKMAENEIWLIFGDKDVLDLVRWPNHKIVTRIISAKTLKKEFKPHDLRIEHYDS